MPMSAAIWLAVAASIVTVVAVVLVLRAQTSTRRRDIGSVSDQWVVKQRLGSGNERQLLKRSPCRTTPCSTVFAPSIWECPACA